MKLRSHEILGTPTTPSSGSRLKQLFQSKKTLFKKNPPRSAAIIHQIPGYVRKSIFRFLLEVKSTPSSPPPPPPAPAPPSNGSSKTVRPPPVMGVQALKTKKKQHTHPSIPAKRSHRIKHQQTSVIVNDLNRSFDEQPISAAQQNNYDMTILHLNIEDDEDESIFAQKTSTNQKKQIPEWARKNELEIAICNQIYFHRNPSEIFGDAFDCSPAHLRTVLHSMLPNVDLFDDNQHQSANRY